MHNQKRGDKAVYGEKKTLDRADLNEIVIDLRLSPAQLLDSDAAFSRSLAFQPLDQNPTP